MYARTNGRNYLNLISIVESRASPSRVRIRRDDGPGAACARARERKFSEEINDFASAVTVGR